ncbi:MAG TPA: patatin-like phospholipase family protein [Candidatus Sulfotelmatobacter sp.]|nr:patatin-like phospholipase family protein [Candidatus Sulfotelmatobacter sp.]
MRRPSRSLIPGILLIFFVGIVLSTLVCGQDASVSTAPSRSSPPRPKIGLALSGGGALGLVEIGVMQWLAENHIPVDRVAGTSMGSIIGAMYATGMSPTDIKTFAKKINWDEAFLPEPTYRELSFRRKQDRRNFLVSAPLGLKHGLRGPNGLNSGQSAGLLLDRIAFPVSEIASFDDLPTPFRCVATDMQTGEAVVLHNGSLSQAVRASMAIPGVFTPVEMNGRVLADGGMVQNIPVETAKGMGADVVIAVELQLPPGDVGQLGTLVGVLSRAIDVMITQNERSSLALADAKVTVDMRGFSINDYNRLDELIQLGYKAAANQSSVLLPHAIQDASEWQAYVDERAARRRKPVNKVDAIRVVGADPDTDGRIQHRLAKDTQGPLNLPRVENQLTQIAGEGQFDRLGYEGFTQNGVPALRITAHEKTYGPPFVDLAVNVEGSGVAAFDFSAGARITFMDILHRGGEWRNDLLFGSSNLGATEFYQPLWQTKFFVAPHAFASKFARNSFQGLTRVAVFGDERAGGGFDVGYNSGLRSEVRVGYELFDAKLSPLIGAAGLPSLHGSTGEVRARFVWDGQDSPSVPSSGTRAVVSLSRVLQSPDLPRPIDQLDVQTSNVFRLSPKTSLFTDISGGATFQGSAGPLQVFELGGQFRLGAYLPYEFIGNYYSYASFGFRRELYRMPQLIGKKIYWGGWYESGTAFGTQADSPGPVVVRGTFNLGVIADTIVGPIAIAGSVSPTGQSRVNFSIGRVF